MQNKKDETEKILKIIQDIAKLTGQTENEVLKKAFEIAGVKIPNYQYIKAIYDFKDIKENDVLILDMNYRKLEDKKIYLLNLKLLNETYIFFGEYNKNLNIFILDDKKNKTIKNDEDIKVLGILTKIQREFNI